MRWRSRQVHRGVLDQLASLASSDGWQQLKAHGRLTTTFTRAENGNVALIGEIDLAACNGTFILALGFGPTPMEAGQHALISLLEDFDGTQAEYVRAWRCWHAKLEGGVPAERRQPLYHSSAAVLRTHESKRVEGGVIASLSIPWGFTKQDDDLGGYHLVWPRDLVQTAGGFIAIGAHEHVRRILRYLQVTQEPDGHWSQNMWLDGTAYWRACNSTRRLCRFSWWTSPLATVCSTRLRVMPIGRWCARQQRFSPVTGPQARRIDGKRQPGYAPFTIASEIAALLVAAEMADRTGDGTAATYLRETADAWNSSIERWLYVSGGPLARQHEVDGYYVRVAPTEGAEVQRSVSRRVRCPRIGSLRPALGR